ncbi:MAG: aminotransferase class I/II-fold pyridoxal phosphate-dependent enzyme [Treponema sp.]|nr:aminotransferase class I/II-fold pyridoxal phosphate-dependent enzyme [Treponema sp.]
MNFDEIIDRRGTGAEKWEMVHREEGKRAVIPLWVADMDFPAPAELTEALVRRAAHPVYGYTRVSEGFFEALAGWYRRRHALDLDRRHFLTGPGTVASLGIAVRSFTEPGQGVLIPTPVYKPAYNMIRFNGREPVEAPLTLNGEGRYCFGPPGPAPVTQALERALSAAADRGIKTVMAVLCSPHNPGGSVWDAEELEAFLAFARQHHMVVISDEIHSDFVFPPKRFVSVTAFPGYADMTAAVSAANKTFNLGGLHLSYFMARDEKLAGILKRGLRASGCDTPNLFALTAAETVFRCGGSWLDELKPYIRLNIEKGVRFLNCIPGVKGFAPEGTYLIWADVSGLAAGGKFRDDMELTAALEREGRVKFTPGSYFGAGGKGFIRINAACPRSQLMEGLTRFKDWAARFCSAG